MMMMMMQTFITHILPTLVAESESSAVTRWARIVSIEITLTEYVSFKAVF